MRAGYRLAAVAIAASMMTSGCFGSFALWHKVWEFNKEVSDDRWVQELAFLLMIIVPVYGVAQLADIIIFNSIEFWTGENPISDVDMNVKDCAATKRIVRDNAEVLLTRVQGANGPELIIEQRVKGEASKTLHVKRVDGKLVASSVDGSVLMTARSDNGRVIVERADGSQVGSYASHQLASLKH